MMRAISLHQPYASGIALGLKTIETRGRITHVRGEVAIHAARSIVDMMSVPFALRRALWNSLGRGSDKGMLIDVWKSLPRGSVVAVVELYGADGNAVIFNDHSPAGELWWGDYSVGRFNWYLRNIRPLREPVACKGKQGFFFLPADVEAKVRAQI